MWFFFRSTFFRHNCIVAWIILFLGATRTVHTCLTAALQAILSFLVSLFTSYDPQSHKISQLYCFQILPSIKVNEGMAPCPFPGFAAPEKYIMFQLKKHRGVMFDCTQDWYKVWRRTGLCFQKLTWGIWQIFTRAL